jgi:hypothetical protein
MIFAVLYSGGRVLVRTYDVVVEDFCVLDFAAAGERWTVRGLKRELERIIIAYLVSLS